MVSDSEVRVACPSITFFFARLGAALGVSSDFLPLVGDFVFVGCGLSAVLGELSLILSQSIAWLEGEMKRMSEVRSNELETRLSSNGSLVKGDIAISTPRAVRAFYALEEVCGLDSNTVALKIGFNFQNEFVFVGPIVRIGLVTFSLVRYASTRLPSLVGLGSPSIRL